MHKNIQLPKFTVYQVFISFSVFAVDREDYHPILQMKKLNLSYLNNLNHTNSK